MTRYQVDSEAVLGTTGAVRNSMGRLQSEVSTLHGLLTSLQGSWSGQASSAFQSVVSDWKVTQQRVEENLAALNQALTIAARQYEEIESSNARLFLH